MSDVDRQILRRWDAMRRRADRCADVAHRLQQSRRHPEWVMRLWVEIGSIHTELVRWRRAALQYDRALHAACDDPTGQDLDSFPFSE